MGGNMGKRASGPCRGETIKDDSVGCELRSPVTLESEQCRLILGSSEDAFRLESETEM